MQTKEEVLKKIKEISDILNKNNVNYIVGASCALLVHGLDVIPNDIDIVIDSKDLTRTKTLLKNFRYEFHTFPIHHDEVCTVNLEGINIRVNKLEAEYKYYKNRENESEKVNKRVKMIEEKLKLKKVISAGGIVVRNNPNKQILLTIFTHINGLGFAKGHVEEGETYEQTAIREVTEETGLTQLSIIKKLGVFNRLGSEIDRTLVDKDIHMFLIKSDRPDFHQQAEEKYGWFDIDEAISKMAIKEDREFLEKIKDEI